MLGNHAPDLLPYVRRGALKKQLVYVWSVAAQFAFYVGDLPK